ncbi:hypothetical protein V866_003687 [Kwoniella sp. B9012]|uniref:Zn(2)-C6 fungal-type domain-containing protein n=1 Tax=Kwoniella europaea PYCC6329 TaxID=1423913 RepID=A0AAX4KIH9_9TREE
MSTSTSASTLYLVDENGSGKTSSSCTPCKKKKVGCKTSGHGSTDSCDLCINTSGRCYYNSVEHQKAVEAQATHKRGWRARSDVFYDRAYPQGFSQPTYLPAQSEPEQRVPTASTATARSPQPAQEATTSRNAPLSPSEQLDEILKYTNHGSSGLDPDEGSEGFQAAWNSSDTIMRKPEAPWH